MTESCVVKPEVDDGSTALDSLCSSRTSSKAQCPFAVLQGVISQPPPPLSHLPHPEKNLTPSQVENAILALVPEVSSWLQASSRAPVLGFIIRSCSYGFPDLPLAVSQHCSESLCFIVSALADPEGVGIAPERAKFLAKMLALAFKECQAVQARTIDKLQAEIRGLTTHSLPAQLRLFVEERREASLDRTVCHFHPNAASAGPNTPEQQFTHVMNLYRRHLGHMFGLVGPLLAAAEADEYAQGPLPVPRLEAEAYFWEEFDARQVCRDMTIDVNQRTGAARRIDGQLLLAWAGAHPEVAHRIFYDETTPEVYGDIRPSLDQVAMKQPCIHEMLACEILLTALGTA